MIEIMKCGYESKHKTKFALLMKSGVPNYILLLIKSEAFIEQKEQAIHIKPNTAILFDRNTYVHYGCEQPIFNDDWIHFDFVNEPSLLDCLNIPFNTPIPLPYISQLSNYVRMMVQEGHSGIKHKDLIRDSLMRTLLYSLDSQLHQLPVPTANHKHYHTMSRLRTNIHNAPHRKWTVEQMADSVHMSPSYFQHLYKELFEISCIQDLIHARIQYAKFYLGTTDMSIQSLSNFCGYENELHFMRQFKKFEGMTPTQYRQMYRQ